MSNEEFPNVEEIKDRLKIEIPVEEEPVAQKPQPDLVDEFKNVGRQFAETIRTAWASQERQRIEAEIREGVKLFADEVSKAVHEVKDSPPAQRAKEEASNIKGKVESGEIAQKARVNLAQGLHWLSEELERLSQQFTPVEKSPTEPEE